MKLCLYILGTKEWKQFAALKLNIHNLGKCIPFPPEWQFKIIEYAMGTKVFFHEKKMNHRSNNGSNGGFPVVVWAEHT